MFTVLLLVFFTTLHMWVCTVHLGALAARKTEIHMSLDTMPQDHADTTQTTVCIRLGTLAPFPHSRSSTACCILVRMVQERSAGFAENTKGKSVFKSLIPNSPPSQRPLHNSVTTPRFLHIAMIWWLSPYILKSCFLWLLKISKVSAT